MTDPAPRVAGIFRSTRRSEAAPSRNWQERGRIGAPPDVRLETARLRLRRFTRKDVDHLVDLDADPLVMRYINGGRGTTSEEVEQQVLPQMMRWYDVRPGPGPGLGLGHWAAELRETGDFVGWFGLSPLDDSHPDDLSLGYRLCRQAWGRGLATEGCRALVDSGFLELGAARITAETMTVNTSSRRVMDKVGMTYVRTFFVEWPDIIDGSDLGDVEYAVDRVDWLAAQTDVRP